jgi:hypothetical protein
MTAPAPCAAGAAPTIPSATSVAAGVATTFPVTTTVGRDRLAASFWRDDYARLSFRASF